jgi:hypothetical protein
MFSNRGSRQSYVLEYRRPSSERIAEAYQVRAKYLRKNLGTEE